MIKKITKDSLFYEKLKEIANIEKNIFKDSCYDCKTLYEMINNNENYMIFYYEEEKILAYLIIMDSFDCFEILKIAVLNEARRKGIATNLIKIKEIQEKSIFLEVRKSNENAINFYIKNEFKKISERKNYYKDNNEDAIIMKLEVD